MIDSEGIIRHEHKGNPIPIDFLFKDSPLSPLERFVCKQITRGVKVRTDTVTEISNGPTHSAAEIHSWQIADEKLSTVWDKKMDGVESIEEFMRGLFLETGTEIDTELHILKNVLLGRSATDVLQGKGTCLDRACLAVLAITTNPYRMNASRPKIIPYNLASIVRRTPNATRMHDHYGVAFERDGVWYGMLHGGASFSIDYLLGPSNREQKIIHILGPDYVSEKPLNEHVATRRILGAALQLSRAFHRSQTEGSESY